MHVVNIKNITIATLNKLFELYICVLTLSLISICGLLLLSVENLFKCILFKNQLWNPKEKIKELSVFSLGDLHGYIAIILNSFW